SSGRMSRMGFPFLSVIVTSNWMRLVEILTTSPSSAGGVGAVVWASAESPHMRRGRQIKTVRFIGRNSVGSGLIVAASGQMVFAIIHLRSAFCEVFFAKQFSELLCHHTFREFFQCSSSG